MNLGRHTLAVMLTRATDPETDEVVIRRELRAGDAEAIAELHRRIYQPEFAMNDAFVSGVAGGLADAAARGWPGSTGAVWLVERAGELAGSLGLTVEPSGAGRVRWFVLDHSLRGRGLGRRLIGELLAEARAAGLTGLELETFGALTVAARIYRAAGFRLVSERERVDLGRPVTWQRYELQLR
jgi:GNAT superfamily N-acetyltransferase